MWSRTPATGSISAVRMTTCRRSMSSKPANTGYCRMNDRVLVTGARGFIGRPLVKALRAASFDVLEHSTEQGDIARCELRYAGIGRVFHLAGRSFVPDSWVDTRAFYETNVLGTVNVLEFCRRQ